MSTRILDNGFRTLISISGVTALFEEVSVTPMGVEADEAVELSNMRSANYRTFAGGALLMGGDVQVKVHYATGAYSQIIPLLRQNRYVEQIFPDGTRIGVYCIVQSFVPEELTMNERPTATLTLKPSFRSTSNPPAEVAPVITTGTTTTTAPI